MATEPPFADREYLDRYARAQTLMERAGLDARVESGKITRSVTPPRSDVAI